MECDPLELAYSPCGFPTLELPSSGLKGRPKGLDSQPTAPLALR